MKHKTRLAELVIKKMFIGMLILCTYILRFCIGYCSHPRFYIVLEVLHNHQDHSPRRLCNIPKVCRTDGFQL